MSFLVKVLYFRFRLDLIIFIVKSTNTQNYFLIFSTLYFNAQKTRHLHYLKNREIQHFEGKTKGGRLSDLKGVF